MNHLLMACSCCRMSAAFCWEFCCCCWMPPRPGPPCCGTPPPRAGGPPAPPRCWDGAGATACPLSLTFCTVMPLMLIREPGTEEPDESWIRKKFNFMHNFFYSRLATLMLCSGPGYGESVINWLVYETNLERFRKKVLYLIFIKFKEIKFISLYLTDFIADDSQIYLDPWGSGSGFETLVIHTKTTLGYKHCHTSYQEYLSFPVLWIGIVWMPIQIRIWIYIWCRSRSGLGLKRCRSTRQSYLKFYSCWKIGEKIYFYSQKCQFTKFFLSHKASGKVSMT